MHVIAALDEERQAEAERAKQIVGPRTERDHHRRRAHRTARGLHLPAAACRLQRARVAGLHPPAARRKSVAYACASAAGSARRQRIGIMPPRDGPAQVRLELSDWSDPPARKLTPIWLELRRSFRIAASSAAPTALTADARQVHEPQDPGLAPQSFGARHAAANRSGAIAPAAAFRGWRRGCEIAPDRTARCCGSAPWRIWARGAD